MKITVKTMDSATAEFEVSGEMTVRQLKSEIHKKMSVPPAKQRLLFRGNALRVPDNTLMEYSIGDGAEIQLVLDTPTPDEKVGVLPQLPPEEAVVPEAGDDAEGTVDGQVDLENLSEQQKKEDEEHEKDMKEKEKRNLKDIHKHVKNTKKCTEWAIKFLDRYDKAERKREEWQRAREAGEELAGLDKEDDPDEKPEPRKRRFPWQDDDNEPPLQPIERSEFAALMKAVQDAQDRGRPMLDRYHALINTDPALSVEEGLTAERLAQTVKEFNYYIGHAMISLSRLEMTMNTQPPRPVKLAPTRRTEMRRVMRDLRNMPPRAPSGYIVDIQREGGPIPVGTRNAPAPTDPLTSVALGSKDKKKKKDDDKKDDDKKDDDKKDGEGGGSEGASGSGPAPGGDGSTDKKEGEEGEGKSADEPMDQEGEGAGKQATTDGEEPKKERTRDVLAKLLTGMVSGMMGSDDEEEEEGKGKGEGEGEGEEKKEGEKEEEKKEKEEEKRERRKRFDDSDDSDDDDDGIPKKTFAEKYVGPPGTVVTIQSIPQPPFGIPTMNPQPGPSLCIRNSGDSAKPDVKVNFPMPPALQMLQDLLGDSSSEDDDVSKPESEMTEEEKEKKQRREKKKLEKEKKAKEREIRRKKKEKEEKEEKERERQLRRMGKETKAFTPKEEADIGELSDAGSIDSMDSQHDYLESHHVDNPMVRLAYSASNEIEGGIHETVYDSMVDAYAHMGKPVPLEVEEEAGMMELLFEAISKHLSVLEAMSLMWGVEEPMKRLQPCLYQFIRAKLLKGEDPTADKKKEAATCFLSPFIPSVNSTMMSIFPKEGVDLPHTLYSSLYTAMEEVYDIIIIKQKDEAAFAKQLHGWATKTSLLCAALLHHTARNDDFYEDTAKQLFTVFLPGETPAMALGYPYASIGREMARMKTAHKYTAEELEKMVKYKPGSGPPSKASSDNDKAGEGGGASADSAPQQPPPPSDPQPDGQEGGGGGGGEGEQQTPMEEQKEGEQVEAEGRDVATGSELMGKSLQSAIATSGATPTSGVSVDAIVNEAQQSSGLVEGLGREMEEGVRERLEGDPDFNPQQFPTADKVYQPGK